MASPVDAASGATWRSPQAISALVATLAFLALTVRAFAGGTPLDTLLPRLSGWVLQGWLDNALSSMWFLGEPQLGSVLAVALGAVLAALGFRRAAVACVAGMAALLAVELGIRLAIDHVHGLRLSFAELDRLYPSGHAARPPFLGAAATLAVTGRWRALVVAVAALVTIAVALDRIDSRVQSGTAVLGGLLLGLAAALWLAAFRARLRRTGPDRAG